MPMVKVYRVPFAHISFSIWNNKKRNTHALMTLFDPIVLRDGRRAGMARNECC
jgi:hypothetical protein